MTLRNKVFGLPQVIGNSRFPMNSAYRYAVQIEIYGSTCLQPFNLYDSIKVTMKQNVYDYSFEMRRTRKRNITFGLVLALSVILFLTLLLNLVLFPVLVRSSSMDPDIPKNGAVFITPLVRTPGRGDVVYLSSLDGEKIPAPKAFVNRIVEFFTLQQYYPFGHTNRISGKPMLRRVVGLPGDQIYMKDYVIYVKPRGQSQFLTEFELSDKDYDLKIYSVPAEWDGLVSSGNMDTITLGKDEYFVLADNRIEASDSRLWGPVQHSVIKGKALLQYFPFNKIRLF
ncbi:MAG TPA: signal peptidase I [Treponema sp.]|nr:signal peptidase I [Treponema sp.]